MLNYPPPLQSIPNRNLGANGVMDKALTCWVGGYGLISIVGNSDLGAAMIRRFFSSSCVLGGRGKEPDTIIGVLQLLPRILDMKSLKNSCSSGTNYNQT